MNRVIRGNVYLHYKNKKYLAIGIATHTETMEEFVVYRLRDLEYRKEPEIWVRPKEMFFEDVEVNGVSRPRFNFLYNIFN